jgi:hypothetical protein
MTAPEKLRGIIIGASDPDDRDDIATRRILVAELGITLAMCPSAEERRPIAMRDEGGTLDLCTLGRRLTPDCLDCLLSG